MSKPPASLELEQATVVLTGRFTGMSRKELISLLNEHGADVTGAVSGETTCLIVGSKGKSGAKLAKAESLGTPVFSEATLYAHLGVTPEPAPSSRPARSRRAAPAAPAPQAPPTASIPALVMQGDPADVLRAAVPSTPPEGAQDTPAAVKTVFPAGRQDEHVQTSAGLVLYQHFTASASVLAAGPADSVDFLSTPLVATASNKNQKPFDIDPTGRWALYVSDRQGQRRECPHVRFTSDAIHHIDLETRAVEEVFRGEFIERCALVPGGFLALDRDRLRCFAWTPGAKAEEAWVLPRGGLGRLTGTGTGLVGLSWKTRRYQSVWAAASLEGLRWLAQADFEPTEHTAARFPQAPSGGVDRGTVWIRARHRAASGPFSEVLTIDNPGTATGAAGFADVALDLRADQLPWLQVAGREAIPPAGTPGRVVFGFDLPSVESWIVSVESGMRHPGRYLGDGRERWKWDLIEKEFAMADAFKGVSVKDLIAYFGADTFRGFRKNSDRGGAFSQKKSAWKSDSRTFLELDEALAFTLPALPFDELAPGALKAHRLTLFTLLDPGAVQHRSKGVQDRRDYLWGRTPVSDKDKARANRMLARKPALVFPPEDRRGIALFDRGFTVLPDLEGLQHTCLSLGHQDLIRTEGIAALPEIEELSLYETSIHYLSSEIGQLTRLRKLDLACTGLRRLPPELSRCTALDALTLPDHILDWDEDANLAVLATLKSLKTLSIGRGSSEERVTRIQALLPGCEISVRGATR